MTHVTGNMTWKYGSEFWVLQQANKDIGNQGRFDFGNEWTRNSAIVGGGTGVGSTLGSYLLGLPHNSNSSFPWNADKFWSQPFAGFFVQNDWRLTRKLTLNLGARFDRYRAWLPEQTLPAGRFVPATVTFPERSEVILFNHLVPRVGATYDLTGDGRTVLKANWGRFAFNPGVNLADAVNPNTSTQYAVWTWNDLNGDRVFQDNEKVGTAPTQQFGGNVSTTGAARKHRGRASPIHEREFILPAQQTMPGSQDT
jgi:outer membrane receptor protein involved in Fe transport